MEILNDTASQWAILNKEIRATADINRDDVLRAIVQADDAVGLRSWIDSLNDKKKCADGKLASPEEIHYELRKFLVHLNIDGPLMAMNTFAAIYHCRAFKCFNLLADFNGINFWTFYENRQETIDSPIVYIDMSSVGLNDIQLFKDPIIKRFLSEDVVGMVQWLELSRNYLCDHVLETDLSTGDNHPGTISFGKLRLHKIKRSEVLVAFACVGVRREWLNKVVNLSIKYDVDFFHIDTMNKMDKLLLLKSSALAFEKHNGKPPVAL